MSSGGGGSGTQGIKTEWNDVIGSYYGGRPDATGQNGGGVLGWAAAEAAKPWQQYGGQRIADRNMDQYTAAQRVRNMANTGGPYETQIARQAAGTIAAGGGINANPYMGENKYFKDMVANANADTTNAYNQGTSAELTRLMNMSGAFGGSAHQNAMANNQAALAKQIGNQTTNMYGQQFDKSANLYEQGLNRQMSAIPLAFQGQGLQTDLNNQLMGIGDWEQGTQQKYLDQAYGDWTNAQNWSRGNIDWLLSKLGGAAGNTGTQTQFGGYQGPNYGSQALGLGLLGRGLGLY